MKNIILAIIIGNLTSLLAYNLNDNISYWNKKFEINDNISYWNKKFETNDNIIIDRDNVKKKERENII